MKHKISALTFATMASISQCDPSFMALTALLFAGAGILDLQPYFRFLRNNKTFYKDLNDNLQRELKRLLSHTNDAKQQELIKKCGEILRVKKHSLSKQEMQEVEDAQEASNIVLAKAATYLASLPDDDAQVLRELIIACYATVFPKKQNVAKIVAENSIQINESLKVLKVLENLQKNLPEEIAKQRWEDMEFAKQISALSLLDIPQRSYHKDFTSPTMLLQANFLPPVPFHFREDVLHEIDKWCTSDKPLRLQVYEGKGGTGKTRLFFEVCKKYRAEGWEAGFFQLSGDSENLWDYLFRGETPMLVVLDYAERQATEQFQRLLVTMYQAVQGERLGKLRIVLLTRTTGDWWKQLQEDSDLSSYLASGTVELTKVLPSLTDIETDSDEQKKQKRKESFEKAARHFAELLDKPVPPTATVDLSADYFERVLYLHLQALASVEGSEVLSERKLLDFILKRESKFLRQQLKSRGLHGILPSIDAVIHALVAFTAMRGVDTDADALDILKNIELLKEKDADVLQVIVNLLHETYAGNQWIEPVMPDILIEEMYGEYVNEALLDIMLSHKNADVLRVLNHLNALAQRRPEKQELLELALQGRMEEIWRASVEVAISTGGPIGQLLAKQMEKNTDIPLAEVMQRELPRDTTALLELKVVTGKQIYDAISKDNWEERAIWAHNLTFFLMDVGRYQKALVTTQEAVDIYRKLAEKNPDAFLADLAMSLNSLGIILSYLGRYEEAFVTTQEAVDIYRSLAENNPNAFLSYSARSLHNLGSSLSDFGRYEKALVTTQEAVDIYRKLAEKNPDAFLADLASSLNSLSVILSYLVRYEKALVIAQESVDIYLELAEKNPDAFLADLANLAMLLHNLGSSLSNLGRYEEAFVTAQEAVDIYRKLAEKNPDVFLADLARSLNNLGVILKYLGRYEEAFVTAQEAVDIYRKLAEKNPGVFLADLARSLNNLGSSLSDLGSYEKALVTAQEAVDIYRKLAEKNPDILFLADLPRSLNSLGVILSDLGRYEKALVIAQEAVDILRRLAENNQDVFLANLAMSLNNLGNALKDLDKHQSAYDAYYEALKLCSPFFLRLPQAFAKRILYMVKDYQNQCEMLALQPDMELLTPITSLLEELEN